MLADPSRALPGRVAVIVPAAGSGERLGPGGPKALRLLRGEPLLAHALRALLTPVAPDGPLVGLVVVAAPPAQVAAVTELLGPLPAGVELLVVAGGPDRRASVRLALDALHDRDPTIEVVLVHDAARPLVPAPVVARVVAAVRAGAAAVVPAIAVVDTVKQVGAGGAVVEATLDRSRLRAVQTPQGFRREVLRAVHAGRGGLEATDDAGLVEADGGEVVVVEGHEEAFKVTRPLDLLLAEAVLARRDGPGAP